MSNHNDSAVPERQVRLDNQKALSECMAGRRRQLKAAVLCAFIYGLTLLLHLTAAGIWVMLTVVTLVGLHAVRLLGATPLTAEVCGTEMSSDTAQLPFVSLVIAAKNEQAVLPSLVENLCHLDYPRERYEIWIVDDNSSDRTPSILQDLSEQYSHLHWYRRPPQSSGGKSGALNDIRTQIKGEIIGVFDADARVPPNLIQAVLPAFDASQVGAIQVRKSILNAQENFLTAGQSVEMIFDAFWQDQRTAAGGIGELRGNGQFLRRTALDDCGGWNEQTITDDLDLSIRLHIREWDIVSVFSPATEEEGVTHPVALWHQRNRWAEGGFQRYLDYWPLLFTHPQHWRKRIDLLIFWVIQYFVPIAAVPDTLLSLTLNHYPVYLPIASLTVPLSFLGIFLGQVRIYRAQKVKMPMLMTLWRSMYGMIYLCHWFVVMASVTHRMALRPKRLNWVKTVHLGASETASS